METNRHSQLQIHARRAALSILTRVEPGIRVAGMGLPRLLRRSGYTSAPCELEQGPSGGRVPSAACLCDRYCPRLLLYYFCISYIYPRAFIYHIPSIYIYGSRATDFFGHGIFPFFYHIQQVEAMYCLSVLTSFYLVFW